MSNDWDIPELDIGMAAPELVPPVTKWGTRRRDGHMAGTWHFYTWDYRYTHLQRYPGMVPATRCVAAVEPNYTITPETPRAEAIHLVYLKRKLARAWQEAGVRIVVDLNLDNEGKFHDLGLLGVPVGWPSYATRVHRGNPWAVVEAEFDAACRHARGTPSLFVVFGGGRKVKRKCQAIGWTHVPEHRQVIAGIEKPYGESAFNG